MLRLILAASPVRVLTVESCLGDPAAAAYAYAAALTSPTSTPVMNEH